MSYPLNTVLTPSKFKLKSGSASPLKLPDSATVTSRISVINTEKSATIWYRLLDEQMNEKSLLSLDLLQEHRQIIAVTQNAMVDFSILTPSLMLNWRGNPTGITFSERFNAEIPSALDSPSFTNLLVPQQYFKKWTNEIVSIDEVYDEDCPFSEESIHRKFIYCFII